MTKTLIAVAAALVAARAGAQGIGTPGYDLRYGREYYAAGNYTSAETRFEAVVMQWPENAQGHYWLALAVAKQGKADSARAEFARAVRADASLQRGADSALATFGARAAAPASRVPHVAGATATPTAAPAQPAAPAAYTNLAVGQQVDVDWIGNGTWVPGVVTRVEYPGACPRYTTRYTLAGESAPREGVTGCKTTRPATAATRAAAGRASSRNTVGGALTLGDWSCSRPRYDYAARQQRNDPAGYFTLRAGGRYGYLNDGGSGTYAYDAGTGTLRFTSGPLKDRGASGKLTRRDGRPQIDVEFGQGSAFYWQCAPSR